MRPRKMTCKIEYIVEAWSTREWARKKHKIPLGSFCPLVVWFFCRVFIWSRVGRANWPLGWCWCGVCCYNFVKFLHHSICHWTPFQISKIIRLMNPTWKNFNREFSTSFLCPAIVWRVQIRTSHWGVGIPKRAQKCIQKGLGSPRPREVYRFIAL